jgi:hypothetical protein
MGFLLAANPALRITTATAGCNGGNAGGAKEVLHQLTAIATVFDHKYRV